MTSTARPQRAFWNDARFLIGVALVIVSVAGVWLLVSTARHTTPVLQASRTIVQGEPLTSADFRVVDVSLGTVTGDYLAPQDLDSGLIAARTVSEGELMPTTATAAEESVRTTTIVVQSGVGVPADVDAGTVIELWQSPPTPDGRGFDAPRLLIADAIVVGIVESRGMVADARDTVEIVIDRSDVADVLAAITGGSSMSVVPVGASS